MFSDLLGHKYARSEEEIKRWGKKIIFLDTGVSPNNSISPPFTQAQPAGKMIYNPLILRPFTRMT